MRKYLLLLFIISPITYAEGYVEMGVGRVLNTDYQINGEYIENTYSKGHKVLKTTVKQTYQPVEDYVGLFELGYEFKPSESLYGGQFKVFYLHLSDTSISDKGINGIFATVRFGL